MSTLLSTTRPRPAGYAGPDAALLARWDTKLAQVEAAGRTHTEMLPTMLSPSRASEYKKCPLSFYYTAMVGLTSPATTATARGTLAHSVFERVFDHPGPERTVELALSYLRPSWEQMLTPTGDPSDRKVARALRSAPEYNALAPAGSQNEAEILEFAEQVVRSWFAMERVGNLDPAHLQLPDGNVIDGREVHVGTPLSGVYVHGYIDRLDTWTTPAGRAYAVTDYKTGKVPGAGKTYAPHVVERILWDSFFQLRLYALLLWKVHQVPVNLLRLVYVATGDRSGGIKTMPVTRDVIARTEAEINAIWTSVQRSATLQTWQPRTGPLCDWCPFRDQLCPAFTER